MKLLVTSYLLLTMLLGADARLDGTQAPGKRVHHEHEVAESRIVGGNAASVGEYLYFVSWNGCAASLIAEDVILSAAHCAGIRSDNVIVGAHQKWWGQTSGDAEKRTISERRIHPEYASNTFTNDFIVMKLTDPVTHIDPVILNFDAASPTEDETLTAIGFGSLRQGGWTPRLLQEVAVQYVSHDQCNAEYDGDIIEDVMLCAGVTGGGKDSCQGDSGGPIVRKTDEGHIQVGVVSWGYGCAQAEFSGVYSRTSGAQQWIEQQVCELSSSVNKPSYCSENNGGLTEEPEDEPDEDPEEDPVTPPGKSDCVDSDTDTFLVDEALGNRGCNFLKDEMEQYGYLCKFVDVAFVCPDLCEICNRIEEFNQ